MLPLSVREAIMLWLVTEMEKDKFIDTNKAIGQKASR